MPGDTDFKADDPQFVPQWYMVYFQKGNQNSTVITKFRYDITLKYKWKNGGGFTQWNIYLNNT